MQKIELPRGLFALVDDRDYCYLSQWKWNVVKPKKATSFYAIRTFTLDDGKRSHIYMHRAILLPEKNKVIDHINHNGLDNTRENMRVVSFKENMRNQQMQKNNTSGFRGVYFYKKGNNYCARTVDNEGKNIFLGYFKTKEEARKESNVKYGFHENHGTINNDL